MMCSLAISTVGVQAAALFGVGNIGWTEGLLIAFLMILLFGARRLPEIGQSLGKGIREFKKSLTSPDESPQVTAGDRDVTQVDASKREEKN